LELTDFEEAIRSGRSWGPTLADARATLEIVEKIYQR
jgi:predicted dehydrogenase